MFVSCRDGLVRCRTDHSSSSLGFSEHLRSPAHRTAASTKTPIQARRLS
jgi:hypothetical protein